MANLSFIMKPMFNFSISLFSQPLIIFLIMSTWPFLDTGRATWRATNSGFSIVYALVEGCSTFEELPCDGTFGLFKAKPFICVFVQSFVWKRWLVFGIFMSLVCFKISYNFFLFGFNCFISWPFTIGSLIDKNWK